MSDKKCCRVHEDTIERYAMGRLARTSLARFEEHLLLCEECQDRVFEADAYLAALRETLEQPAKAVAHDERRHETRVECDCKVTLRVKGDRKETRARATDQSNSAPDEPAPRAGVDSPRRTAPCRDWPAPSPSGRPPSR